MESGLHAFPAKYVRAKALLVGRGCYIINEQVATMQEKGPAQITNRLSLLRTCATVGLLFLTPDGALLTLLVRADSDRVSRSRGGRDGLRYGMYRRWREEGGELSNGRAEER